MSTSFSHTLRALITDRPRRGRIGVAFTIVLSAAWIIWFCFGHIRLYEVSSDARLEATSMARPITARVPGQVLKTELVLGKQVLAGELLVQLDAQSQQLAMDEGRARIADLRARLDAMDKLIEAENAAAALQRTAGTVALDEHHARVDEALARVNLARERYDRFKILQKKHAVSEDALGVARTEHDANLAIVRSLRAIVARIEDDQQLEEGDREVRLAKLRFERAEVSGDLATQEVSLLRLTRDVELRQIHAPVAGRVGQVGDFPVGAVVEYKEELGNIVPDDVPRAVAYFPAAAAGRIRVAQLSRLRLDGFPWMQYGSIPATVTDVANEPEQGRIRVELKLDPGSNLQIPIQHGLSGSAEVVVGGASPAMLVLRAASWLLRPNPLMGNDSRTTSSP